MTGKLFFRYEEKLPSPNNSALSERGGKSRNYFYTAPKKKQISTQIKAFLFLNPCCPNRSCELTQHTLIHRLIFERMKSDIPLRHCFTNSSCSNPTPHKGLVLKFSTKESEVGPWNAWSLPLTDAPEVCHYSTCSSPLKHLKLATKVPEVCHWSTWS